LKIGVEELQK